MRHVLPIIAVLLSTVAAAAAAPGAAPSGPPVAPPKVDAQPESTKAPLERVDPALVRELAADPAIASGGDGAAKNGGAFGARGTGQARIDREFSDAQKPSCLTSDAFKFDPTQLGPVTFVTPNYWAGGGIDVRALFLAHAILTGRCRD
jgi:hypothetical protein